MANEWKKITYLDISLQSGLTEGHLYANSRHQVGVVISIIPTGAGGAVTITQQQLNESITLVDYATGEKLNTDGWKYSRSRHDYQSLAALPEPDEFVANVNGLYQATRYVTCDPGTKVTARQIGVKIKPTDGNTTYTASANGDANTNVTIKTYGEIVYKLDVNTKVRFFEIAGSDLQIWYNYYLSIDSADDGLEHHIYSAKITPQGQDAPFFVWKEGTPSTKVAWAWALGPETTSTTTPSVVYNQRPAELCISLLRGEFDYPGAQTGTDPKVAIDIYDQYGNRGTFHAKPSGTSDQWEYGDAIIFENGTG